MLTVTMCEYTADVPRRSGVVNHPEELPMRREQLGVERKVEAARVVPRTREVTRKRMRRHVLQQHIDQPLRE